ncbi:MAG: hypothetical protein SFV55_04715 [Haliscomenobacter sp.]|uniref:hypothetical protein n=1 Tax=Haliscomenobacter sp. TaxID=2717303 RepID=UPI0029A268A3|nr:hypothetical protein [Haliscomenobacter sp.]MDX2067704.1 hypothetical protein [Haliscomenobacter sp.]
MTEQFIIGFVQLGFTTIKSIIAISTADPDVSTGVLMEKGSLIVNQILTLAQMFKDKVP